ANRRSASCNPPPSVPGPSCGSNTTMQSASCPRPNTTPPDPRTMADAPGQCAHDMHGNANYFANCTVYTEYGDGTVSINGVNVHRSDLGGVDPRDIAQAIDRFAGNALGDSFRSNPTNFTAVLLGDAYEDAAKHEAELAAKQKELKCNASFWCRN